MTSRTVAVIAVALGTAAPVAAQTDYYNTDSGRPVAIEDAFPVERYAFEGQVAPLRMERSDGGSYHWEFEPEIAYGVLPATQIEVGLHLDVTDQSDERGEFGVGGIDLGILHNLNVETRMLPAFAVGAGTLIPVGDFAPDGVYPSVKAIATRTFRWARVHLNGGYTIGASPDAGEETGELSRWMAGAAIDRTFPLRGALLIADVFVEEPLGGAEELEWTVEAGARYQLNPFLRWTRA